VNKRNVEGEGVIVREGGGGVSAIGERRERRVR